ncbi:MAG: NUDIX domain-containing protein [Flammeovirgaceae bacterium]|nr:NUDIX domain-containing protein [Flammeovirgaceae bacterium]MDW8287908.1 NUDIX domain-containing protein [Flammeovirgaceae bacterium]
MNDISLEVASKKQSATEEEGKVIMADADASQILKHYQMIKEGLIKGQPKFLFYVNDYEKVVSEIKKNFLVLESAGGWVTKKEKVLFIRRLGRWDLPKGKIEDNEGTANAAAREIEEECGVKAKVVRPLCQTWHTYDKRGQEILKCTHWFLMECLDDSRLSPQREEGIEEVVWLTIPEIQKDVLPDTYSSIREVYKNIMKK